jgi:hypothetical protein
MRRREAGPSGQAGADNCAGPPEPVEGDDPSPGAGGGRATGAIRTPNGAAAQAAVFPECPAGAPLETGLR